MDLTNFLQGKKTISVVCNQWGDTGKGKFVDYFAQWADIIARGTGGANAGHTIILNNKKYVFHLVPSGILFDSFGKICIIGQGVAFDPRAFIEELDILDTENQSYDNLKISLNAKLVMPYHLLLDRLKESNAGKNKIGTTGRGIGPLYVDHYDRKGLIVNDILNKDIFKEKLKRSLKDKMKIIETYDKDLIKNILSHNHLENGAFYNEETILDLDKIVEYYTEKYANRLRKYICDSELFLRNNLGKKNILLEGAQGYLLSIDYGSYPFVTSSDPSILGLAKGVGLKESDLDLNLGIVKAFYMTRVGEGPFPTELGGKVSDVHCSTKNRDFEKNEYPNADINSNDEFTQGVAIRFAGNEYGATTGRPRRTGWLDLPLLRTASTINGNDLILTKIDVLSACNTIKLCDYYEYVGEDYFYGDILLKKGDKIETAITDSFVLNNCKPIYSEHEGWLSEITSIKEYDDLPEKLKKIIEYIENKTNTKVRIVSVGAERDETILRN